MNIDRRHFLRTMAAMGGVLAAEGLLPKHTSPLIPPDEAAVLTPNPTLQPATDTDIVLQGIHFVDRIIGPWHYQYELREVANATYTVHLDFSAPLHMVRMLREDGLFPTESATLPVARKSWWCISCGLTNNPQAPRCLRCGFERDLRIL